MGKIIDLPAELEVKGFSDEPDGDIKEYVFTVTFGDGSVIEKTLNHAEYHKLSQVEFDRVVRDMCGAPFTTHRVH